MRAALACGLAVLLLCGAAPPQAVPTSRPLPGGGTAIVRNLDGAPLVAIELWFRAPSIGFDATPHPGIANVAAHAIAASVPLTGTPLATVVARSGGRLGIAVYPHTIAVSALVPAIEAAATLRTMTAVYFTPVLTTDGLDAARTALRRDARIRELTAPEEALRDQLFAALFAGGPAHYAPEGDAATMTLSLDALTAFATRAFRAANATVVLCGAVNGDGNGDGELLSAAVEGRPQSGPGEPLVSASAQLAQPPPPVSRESVASGFGYAWAGPPISSELEATALDFIADYLFNPDTGTVMRALSDADVNVAAQFVTYYDPGVLYVEATGRESPRARTAIDAALAALRTPIGETEFARARAEFEYHVLSDVSTPLALADDFGWYASEGNVAYAPGADPNSGRYAQAIRALTPRFVAATAAKYLEAAPAVVTFSEHKT
ncbi:MAG: insulinase family protein [Candidatus Eremiobacteraeota bacterium]|nr:insulinase family protein [Candidatus Eremiobacteraeota bacterium]